MSLVYSRSQSGLVVAEQGADEAAIAAALRDYDRDLRLVPQDSDTYGRRVYKVYRYAGSERPAEFVCWWGDPSSGEPYPLSHRLLEMVRELDKRTRGVKHDADEANARLAERLARRRDESELADEHARFAKRSYPAKRSVGLRMARDRMRARGEKA